MSFASRVTTLLTGLTPNQVQAMPPVEPALGRSVPPHRRTRRSAAQRRAQGRGAVEAEGRAQRRISYRLVIAQDDVADIVEERKPTLRNCRARSEARPRMH